MTIPVGLVSAADVAGSPSAGALVPPPATVLIVPSRSIERTRVLDPPSVTSTRRDRSTSRLVAIVTSSKVKPASRKFAVGSWRFAVRFAIRAFTVPSVCKRRSGKIPNEFVDRPAITAEREQAPFLGAVIGQRNS